MSKWGCTLEEVNINHFEEEIFWFEPFLIVYNYTAINNVLKIKDSITFTNRIGKTTVMKHRILITVLIFIKYRKLLINIWVKVSLMNILQNISVIHMWIIFIWLNFFKHVCIGQFFHERLRIDLLQRLLQDHFGFAIMIVGLNNIQRFFCRKKFLLFSGTLLMSFFKRRYDYVIKRYHDSILSLFSKFHVIINMFNYFPYKNSQSRHRVATK